MVEPDIIIVGLHSTPANTISNWLYALHMGTVFWLPYRILVCVLRLVVAMLSVTGVYLWWKKRRSRLVAASRRGERPSRRLVET